jgi:23S rRNA pseudouridine1911/1915/1917 synthase
MTEDIKHQIILPEESRGMRLDQALARALPEYSRERLKDWIKKGDVLLNQQTATPKTRVQGGEQIDIHTELEQATDWQGQAIPLDILYEDDDVMVVNKPAGMVVHPAAGNPDKTLVNAILHHAPETQQLARGGIIHRLDKDTTGCLAIAKNITAHHSLTQQLAARDMKRTYLALVRGELISGATINAPIARHPKHRTKMAVVSSGRPSTTHYRIEDRFNGFTLLRVQLETGRTHQIRVHMAHAGHPIVGCQNYGGRLHFPKNSTPELRDYLQHFKRQALHAVQLSFEHPRTHETMTFDAPLPDDFKQLLAILKNADQPA